jgi:hypothetical protein
MKALLSYPRSGNHLVRFLIELLTEKPTLGCSENPIDVPMYLNKYKEEIPFNIDKTNKYNEDELYLKYHDPPKQVPDALILIVRNPNEVLLRHLEYSFIERGWHDYDTYFDNIEFFNSYNGNKTCFYYEDIITDKIKFIEELCNFLEEKNEYKKNYVIENVDKLYKLSAGGEGRDWGGIISVGKEWYYKDIKQEYKSTFDNYINDQMKTGKYELIRKKYFTTAESTP